MRRLPLPPLLVSLLLVTACTTTPDPGPRFDDEAQNPDLTCVQHQPAPPGPRYTDPAQRDTADTLALLRYYTTHNAKPYCDNQAPTPADRAWAQVYTDLGGNPANVTNRLG
ncbi:hypothetical protein ACTG9Q_12795 [Actinokineospora sp. 24-640]